MRAIVEQRRLIVGLVLTLAWTVSQVDAQTFNSGSDESDGALVINTPGTTIFDPASFIPPIDTDGDGIYHFTTITISNGVTVIFDSAVLGNKAISWLATGDVQIDGTLDLKGEDGHAYNLMPVPAKPGSGGYAGGMGRRNNIASGPFQGNGPGGGNVANDFDYGGEGQDILLPAVLVSITVVALVAQLMATFFCCHS
ncbi:MAG: hypothetical protein GKR87_15990 [Kiritimatiellae bacterium]|nr:hypothetical protein [Kiritimatiellia bacterium]